MAKSVDEQVLALLVKVKKQQDVITQLEKRPTWITSCTIGFSDAVHDRVNIQVVKDPNKLVEIYAGLLAREGNWKQANLELGLLTEPVHQGYKIADWKTDLKTRAGQLSIETKKKELEKLNARVNALVSPEQRRAMELAALTAELGMSDEE